jgi:hypothetical protein
VGVGDPGRIENDMNDDDDAINGFMDTNIEISREIFSVRRDPFI